MPMLTTFRKMVGDLSNPKLLAAYFIGFFPVLFILSLAITGTAFENVAEMTITEQEERLYASYVAMAYLWGIGIPLLVYGGILNALTLAKEAENGTLGLLLSKPIKRREVLLASFAAVVVVMALVATANLLLVGLFLYVHSGVSGAAIEAGIFAALPAAVVTGVLFALFITAFGTLLAVLTRDRLRTAVGVLAIPALFLAFMIFRLFASDIYSDYGMYIVDINHHFGSAYVYLLETLGTPLDLQAEQQLSIWTGAYEYKGGTAEELPESFELLGFDPAISAGLLVVGAILLLGVASYRFERLDLS
jgi:ABC-2 type transport system permease protein